MVVQKSIQHKEIYLNKQILPVLSVVVLYGSCFSHVLKVKHGRNAGYTFRQFFVAGPKGKQQKL